MYINKKQDGVAGVVVMTVLAVMFVGTLTAINLVQRSQDNRDYAVGKVQPKVSNKPVNNSGSATTNKAAGAAKKDEKAGGAASNNTNKAGQAGENYGNSQEAGDTTTGKQGKVKLPEAGSPVDTKAKKSEKASGKKVVDFDDCITVNKATYCYVEDVD